MSQVETVLRDSRSYRQGLVLGLTMAELFLLLVFALLIALASLWHAEHLRRLAAEAKLGIPSELTDAERNLLPDIKETLRVTGRETISKTLAALREHKSLHALSADELGFVDDVRKQQAGKTPSAISDDWRRLTRTIQSFDTVSDRVAFTDAVQKAYPDIKDPGRAINLIEQGFQAEKHGEHNWPPIINLSEAQNHSFESGKAELQPAFENHLRSVIAPQLDQLAKQYRTGTIEVIGHTDEQRISQRYSNLDASLLDIVRGTASVPSLTPADNAGLGLARAVAVTRILMQDPRLAPYNILPLSAGPLITTSDHLTEGGGGANKERRRIEIRLRRSNPAKFVPDQSTDNRSRN